MVKILLIQLDRFGDNLFVVPLIKGLKRRYPDSHITVLVREEFKDILEGYRDVDCVEVAEWLDISLMTPGFDETEIIIGGYKELKKIIYDLRGRGFNRVYNLNFNKMTTLLTSLLNIPESVGFTVDDNGERVIKGPWVNYMGCMVQNRRYNPFHIADVYRNFEPGLSLEDMNGFNIDTSAEEYADKLLINSGVTEDTPIVAFQPAASNRKRIWPAQNFSRLAEMLSKTGFKVVILGTGEERYIASEIKARNPEVIDLTGKTTFQQLAALLRRCKLLVSNDTGTVHLASAVGVKVTGLYMCHACPIETGPYGEGHITVSPVIDCFPCNWKEACQFDYKCREYITPEDVYSVVKLALSSGEPVIDIAGRVDVKVSAFDSEGFISYTPLVRREISSLDILGLAYKRMWNEALNAQDRPYRPDADIRRIKEVYEICDIDMITREIKNTISFIKRSEALADKGFQKTEDILGYIFSSNNRDNLLIQSWIGELGDIDEAIRQIGKESGPAGLLTTFFEMTKNNLPGRDPIHVLRDSKDVYGLLKLCSSRFCTIASEIVTGLSQSQESVIVNDYNDEKHPERLALLLYCTGHGIDVGCGHRKTSANCIGVDIIGKGETGSEGCVTGKDSVADIQASGDNLYMFKDKEFDFVISRHNLEHYQDIVKTLQEWKRILKIGGILAAVLPDDRFINTIALDPTHKHVFTPESFERLLGLIGGFEIIKSEVVIPNWSFISVATRCE